MKYGKGVYGVKDRRGKVITIDGKAVLVELKNNGIYLRSHEPEGNVALKFKGE